MSGLDMSGFDISGVWKFVFEKSGFDMSGLLMSGLCSSLFDMSGLLMSGFDMSGFRTTVVDSGVGVPVSVMTTFTLACVLLGFGLTKTVRVAVVRAGTTTTSGVVSTWS